MMTWIKRLLHKVVKSKSGYRNTLEKDKPLRDPIFLKKSNIALVFFGSISEDFLRYIEVHANDWVGERDFVEFEVSHVLAENWQIPCLNRVGFPHFYMINKDIFDQCRGEVSKYIKANEEYVKLSLEEVHYISHRFFDAYAYATALLTDYCNLNCVMCFFHNDKGKKSKRSQKSAMSFDLFKNFVDQTKLSTKNFLLSARGEVLCLKDFLSYVRYATDNFDNVVLGTNGSFLTRETSKALIELGVSTVQVSVDSIDRDSYNAIRVGGEFDDVIENIKMLKELRDSSRSNMNIGVNCIMFEENKEQENEIVEFWRDKIDSISFLAERDDYTAKSDSFFDDAPTKALCFSTISEGPVLSPTGVIAPCCHLHAAEWYEDLPWLLNIHDVTVDDAMKQYHDMMNDPSSPLRKYCSRCSFWKQSYMRDGRGMYNYGVSFR